jgi:hypothetical protein
VLRIGLLALVAVGFAAGLAGASAVTRVKNTKGWLEAVAMDGPLVAYDIRAQGRGCNKVFAWNVLTGTGALVSGKGTCDADSTSTGAGVRELAVAGNRIGWIVNLGGNTESADLLYAASLPRPKERRLATGVRTGDVDGVLRGTWIGGLVGDGDLLAVNVWVTGASGSAERASLRRVRVGLTSIAKGLPTLVARSADRGRIATLGPSETVNIYSAAGLLLRTVKPSSAREIALRKDYLVVLTKQRSVEVFNANTGGTVKALPVAAGAAHLDVHTGIAAYAAGRTVHVLRLTTGKDVVIAKAPRAIRMVQIEAPGLVYAYNTVRGAKEVGNLAFVRMARLIAAVS